MSGVDQVREFVRLFARDPGRVEEPLVLAGAEGHEALNEEGRGLLLLEDPSEAEGGVDDVGGAGGLENSV